VKNNLLSILIGGLTYGTTDFQSFRGIWDCILKRKREWVPTNQYGAQRSTGMFSEALFGVMLFMLPLLNSSSLLFLPSSYLFAGKFLFVPALYFFYDDRRKKVKSPKKKILFQFQRAVFILSFALFIPEIGLAKTGNESHANKTEIRGKYLYVNDKKFIVKGINYGPWRDSSGPNKNYNYPSTSLISKDLTLIKDLHANTILVYDPPQYLLNLAEKNDLLVIYTFAINWWALGTPQFEKEQERILKKIEAFKQNPNILAWELGNEIPIELLQRIHQDTIEKEMHNLYNSIKAIDRSHFIIHGNWPVTGFTAHSRQ
jgi:hypothetical protein